MIFARRELFDIYAKIISNEVIIEVNLINWIILLSRFSRDNNAADSPKPSGLISLEPKIIATNTTGKHFILRGVRRSKHFIDILPQ
jgi:hypothetical protein